MFLLFDHTECKWLDAEHTAFECKVKDPISGWTYVTCHQYSTGMEKTIWDAREYLEILPADDENTIEALRVLVDIQVQAMLDSKAKEKNYHDGAWLAGYATSTDSEFHANAQKFVAWRDKVWRKCYDLLDDYEAGKMERLPTVPEVLAQLPTMEWDEDDIQSE